MLEYVLLNTLLLCVLIAMQVFLVKRPFVALLSVLQNVRSWILLKLELYLAEDYDEYNSETDESQDTSDLDENVSCSSDEDEQDEISQQTDVDKQQKELSNILRGLTKPIKFPDPSLFIDGDDYDSSDEYDKEPTPEETKEIREHMTQMLNKKYSNNSVQTDLPDDNKPIKFYLISDKSKSVEYTKLGTKHSAGTDIYWRGKSMIIPPHQYVTLDFGISLIPENSSIWYTFSLRSSAALAGLFLNPCFSVFDPDYSENIYINVLNTTNDPITIHRGTRFCQLIPMRIIPTTFIPVPKKSVKDMQLSYTRIGCSGHTGDTIKTAHPVIM